MANNVVTFNARSVMKEQVTLHVRVTGLRWAKFRIRCALPLIWLACKIAGTGFEVENDSQPRI